MDRHPAFWRLPSGQRFVKRLRPTWPSRLTAFVHEPFETTPLALAIEAAIRDEGLDDACSIDAADGGPSLVERLRRAYGPRATTPEGFALSLDYVVILAHGVEPSTVLADDLRRFAQVSAGRSEAAAPTMIVISRSGDDLYGAPTWTSHRTYGVLGPLDGASFAADISERGEPFATRLSASVAVEVGAWDLDIIERIHSMPLACAVRPDLAVGRWADERMEAWRSDGAADWSAGSHDLWGGETYVHPLFLAANRPELLRKRVWRGQVAVLFPWLEERRQEVVQAKRARLREDSSAFQGSIDALDWGPICRQLRQENKQLTDYLHSARNLRNQLAHGRPASWGDIDSCLRQSRSHRP